METNTKIEKLSEDEILHLKLTFNGNIARNMINETWQKAFAFYNQHNKIALKMSCRPCYAKVMIFCNTYQ